MVFNLLRGCCVVSLIFWSSFVWGQTEKPPSPVLKRVDLEIPGILVDLRYATTNNFTGKKIYEANVAWLRPATIERLKRVQKDLRKKGFQLVIWDAYRPSKAQWKLWESVPDENFVAHPKKGSRHNRGTTVDITMADLEGRLVEMPTDFDEFKPEAAHFYKKIPKKAQKNRDILAGTMFAHGFRGVPAEWWHYDLADYYKYEMIDGPKGRQKRKIRSLRSKSSSR